MKRTLVLLVTVLVLQIHANTASAGEPPQGSIVGWGSQVVGLDLGGGLVQVAAGGLHSLGLKADGSIVAWGGNLDGQCNIPAPNTGFVAVAAGGYHSLGLKGDGSIVAWGDNRSGQTNDPEPNTGILAVAAFGSHSLGLKADGSIVAWGNNSYGQADVPSPNTDFMALSAGRYHSLGLKGDSSIVAWGENGSGQTNVPEPNTGFEVVSAGWSHNLGVTGSGSIVAWGANSWGQANVPLPNSGFQAVAAGAAHSLALKTDGSIVAWGYNRYGQTDVPAPNSNFVAVAAGWDHSIGLKSDGSIVAWGFNGSGQTNVPRLDAKVVTVPGTSNPWLAGMPDGTVSPAPDGAIGDVAPFQSPALVSLNGARYVEVRDVTGQVAHGPAQVLVGADGNEDSIGLHEQEHGKSGIAAPIDSLLGVFLTDDIPSGTPPAALDFTSAASRDYEVFSPALLQVFFFGDGRTSVNAQQGVIIPASATRLFLGTMDGFEWNNNRGEFLATLEIGDLPGMLFVSLDLPLESSGYEFGPFSPAQRTYTPRNIGTTAINWTATNSNGGLFALSQSGGNLAPGASTSVTVAVVTSEAESQPPGVYTDTINFSNTTNGRGNTTRGVQLTVLNAQPAPGQDVPLIPDLLGHLWEWDDTDGRFKPPVSGTINLLVDQPTYLLTHGWDGDLDGDTCEDPRYAMSSIACAIRERNPDVNILAWDWQGPGRANPNNLCDYPDVLSALGPDSLEIFLENIEAPGKAALLVVGNALYEFGKVIYDARRAGQNAENEGNKLGKALARQIQVNGSLGTELHLIGKSHGGGVLGRAATQMAALGYPPDSLSTLDTPKVGRIRPFCAPLFRCTPEGFLVNSLKYVDPASVGKAAVYYYERRAPRIIEPLNLHGGGFGAPVGITGNLTNLSLNDLLAPPLPDFLHLWIAGSDEAPCSPTSGWYPQATWLDYDPVFDGTPMASSVLDVTSFPTGCFRETDTLYEFVSTACESTAARGVVPESETPGLSLVAFEPFADATTWSGTNASLVVAADPADPANKVILLHEDGDASFFKDVTWPANALEIRFDYMFRQPGGGESLTVHLGVPPDDVIFYDNAETSLATGALTSSGSFYIGQVAGTTARLNFVLRTDVPDGGAPGGELIIDNIRVFGLVPSDVDLDGDVDLIDFAVFQTCFVAGTLPDVCWPLDFDDTETVELADHSRFIEALTGPFAVPTLAPTP